MESRFRKFLSARRPKSASQTSQIDAKSDTSSSPSLQWPLPSPIPRHMSTDSGATIPMAGQDDTMMQSIPYNATLPGKCPTFSSQPVRGNGPIKLQTSRRSATGELLATTQDNRATLESIREGDYIVGRKQPREPRIRSVRRVTPPETPALSTIQTSSESSNSPRTPLDMPTSPWSISNSESASILDNQSDRSLRNGLGLSSTSISSAQMESCQLGPSALDLHSGVRSSCVSNGTASSTRRLDEQNPTIAALWKAESNRLTNIYRWHETSNGILDTGIGRRQLSTSPDNLRVPGSSSQLPLEALPHSNNEKTGHLAERSSNISVASSPWHDENSDTCSNKRTSAISSCAESSSNTIQTNLTDHDSVVTRDDIRKIVEDMRSTYLRALEVHPPSIPKPNYSTKKKRRHKPGTATTSASARSNLSTSERQTWHGNDGQKREVATRRNPKTRATSHPVAVSGRLSPVEASPPREKRPTDRLHRADSTTLGSIMAKIEQDSEVVDASKKVIPTSSLPQASTNETLHLDGAADKMILRNATQRVTCIQARANVQSFILRPEGNFF